ncbi:MAG: hypothetical protein QOG57_3736 [Pseudonocardiales bacterium]|nr:hypothetical protein [Pseudonocardiales bacterium]
MGPGPLRGRSEQMRRALEVLRRVARSGQGAVVVVSGEAGIGKTALLDAISEQAARMGFAVGVGRAEESSRIAPMAALLTAVRSGRSPLLSEATFNDLAPLYDRELWLIDRLAAALEERAARSAILVVVDDVHWADELTVFALRVLPARMAGSPVVWVLATRTTTRGITDVAQRDMPVETVVLGPLSDGAIEQIALDQLGDDPTHQIRALLSGAAGSPFLAVELLAGLVAERKSPAADSDSGLPSQLIIGVRNVLAPLPAEAVNLVRVGSVLGRCFTADDAAALLDGSAERLVLPNLELLERAGVLDDDGQTLTFRHDLLRQAVYEDVPPTVRKAMHRAAARHLNRAGRTPIDAAAHLLLSAEPGDAEAVAVLRRAAAQVAAITPSMAVELIRAAFALLTPADPRWMEVGQETVAILAQARQARAAVLVADELLGRNPGTEASVQIEGLLTTPLWTMGLLHELRERTEKSLTQHDLSDRARAQLMAQRALACSRDEDLATGRESGQAALAEAVRLDDPTAQVTALWALGEIERNDGHNEAALEHFQRLRHLTGAPYSADEILTLQLLDRYDTSADQIAQAERDVSEQGASAPRSVLAFAHMWQDYSLGRLDDAEADALTVLRLGEELNDYAFLTEARLVLSRIAQLRGDPKATKKQLELAETIPRADDGTSAVMLLFMRAWLAESEGDLAGALEPARQVVHETLSLRHRCRWEASWMVEAARIAHRSADHALARDVAAMARTLAQRNPQVLTAIGTSQHIDGILADDPDTLGRAVEALRGGPRPLLLADALSDHGQALLRDGQRDQAVAALDQAGGILLSLGARGEIRRLQGLLRSIGARRRWITSPTRPIEGWGALTDAERRVAHLIAEGHTNKSAAAELYLSANTVATHLRAVFNKLSVTSRVQLVKVVPPDA